MANRIEELGNRNPAVTITLIGGGRPECCQERLTAQVLRLGAWLESPRARALPAEDLLALRCRYAGLLEELRALDDLHRAAGLRCAEAAPLSAAMTCGAATLRAA